MRRPYRRPAALIVALALLGGCAGPGSKGAFDQARYESLALNDTLRTEVVMTALSLLESGYRYGGATPAQGFDCSGFVAYVFDAASRRRLPHNTAMISRLSRPVRNAALKPGDFVFFNTLGSRYSHMGIYLGDDAFINAPSTGGKVRIDSLRNPYYARHFVEARTLFEL